MGGWVQGREGGRKVGEAGTKIAGTLPGASRVKSLEFQEKNKLSPEMPSSTSDTDRLITVLIAQLAHFEKQEARAPCFPPLSLLPSA